ncbi:50S ribosomal protein L4 [Magnetococcales bacterium HHB-1]
MMEVEVRNAGNETVGSVQLKEAVFGRRVRPDILAQAVRYQMAKRRSGTASTKTRSDVAGGNRKPYRQKGTGNARQGTIRAPQFRGGGVVFGPHPRDFSIKMPKKLRRLALLNALSSKAQEGALVVVRNFGLDRIKTKDMVARLKNLEVKGSALILTTKSDATLLLSVRNIPGVDVLHTDGLNVYDILWHETLIVTEAALKHLEEKYA